MRALTFSIGLLFSLFICLLLLSPLHHAHTFNYPLPPLTEDNTFVLEIPTHIRIAKGMEYPLYRYHGQMHTEIGKAQVMEFEKNKVTFKVREETLWFPAGRQGKIIFQLENELLLNLGTNHGFKKHDRLIIFKDHRQIGSLRLAKVGPKTSLSKLEHRKGTFFKENDQNYSGLVVGEYTIQSVVSVYSNNKLLNGLEVLVFVFVLLAEYLLFRKYNLGILALLGKRAISSYNRISQANRRILQQTGILVAGIPICWFIASFLYQAVIIIPVMQKFKRLPLISSQWTLGILVIAAYYSIFAFTKIFPVIRIWEHLSFRPRWIMNKLSLPPGIQKTLIWFLHLFIAYAFAFALIDFLSANVNGIIEALALDSSAIRISRANLSEPRTIASWGIETYHNFLILIKDGTKHPTLDQICTLLRLALWSITIVGCLVGYIHSVLKLFHWTSIRNVDFTILGWLTNAICYGPLLGVVLWSFIPSSYGTTAVITAGPLLYMILFVEFMLNLLYTASIWNMFTKFGVMVDKGLVDKCFFGIIRHPNYTLEAFMFGALMLKGLDSLSVGIGIFFYFFIYWLRSEREEVFMNASNPDYPEYKKKSALEIYSWFDLVSIYL